jgi:outer membrane receptor protein involved in Fe transport
MKPGVEFQGKIAGSTDGFCEAEQMLQVVAQSASFQRAPALRRLLLYLRISMPRVLCLLLGAVALSGSARAQVLYGSLVGNVTDPNHGAVPGAQVRAQNIQTGAGLDTRTDGQGAYQFSNVQSGEYEIQCTAVGFRSFRRTRVEVAANEVVRVDINLELGDINQSIVVTADNPLLQTDRSDVHTDLSRKELTDLPLSGYRNYQSLLGLVPGVTPPVDSNSIAGNPAGSLVANVNGTGYGNNNTRVDGASNTYLWLPHLTAYVSPVESIGSVNVVTNSYDAEQGFASGAVVSVETKSGTNQFHGSAFEYDTNSRLRAHNFFDTSGILPKNIINQFGGTVGGPIRRNHLFFFASYEGMRQRQSFSRLTTVPTDANRAGDFSATGASLYDPATGAPNGTGRQLFPGAIVPAARIDSISKQILGLVPEPNRPGTANNLFLSAPELIDRNNYDGKINWNPTARATVFGRYARFDYSTFDQPALGAAGGRGVASTFPGHDTGTVHSVTAGGTYLISPAMLVDGHFGFTQQGQYGQDTFYGQNIGLDVLKIPGTNGPTERESGFPGFQVSSYEGMGGYINSSPRFRTDRQYQYAFNASLTKGAHNLRWGAEIYRQEMNHYQPAGTWGPRGGFSYTGGVTGLNGGPNTNQFNSLAAFLLGLPATFGKSIPTTDEMRTRQWNYGFYFRDRWQVTRSLTLNLGVRYEYYPMVTRDVGGVGRYDWTTNQVLVGGFGNTPVDTGVSVPTRQFAPRLGLAWRLDKHTVLRTGYGISIDPFPLAIPLRSSYPTVIGQDFVAPNTYQSAGRTADGIGLPAPIDFSSGVVPLPGNVTTQTIESDFNRGYVQSFNFTLQRELGAGFGVEAGYVGSRSIRLTNEVDINASFPGGGAAGRAYAAAFGRQVATTLHDPAFTSNYNALQARLTRRFSGGMSLNVAYTFSKALGYGANNDSSLFFNTPSAIARDRAVLPFDRTHNFRVSSLYELPFGKGKKHLSSGLVSRFAGGWQVNGILSMYSGNPFTVTSSGTSLNAPGNSQTADQVKTSVSTPQGIGSGESWFDPLAFRAVTTVRFGTAGLDILRGPGVVNLDLGLFRTFALSERWKLQFRAEAFNASNTPHFNNPAANASSMVLNGDGTVRSLGGFTEVTSAANDSRQVRFALRLSF